MKYATSVLVFLLLVSSPNLFAQRRRMPGGPDGSRGRLEKFKTMRLVEVLKLGEEDAVRYYSKENAHEDKVRDLMKSRNESLDAIEDLVRGKGDAKELQKRVDEALDIDQKIFAERQRYQEEMKKFLTPEQFGKFIVFERNFGRRVRDAMEEMHEKRREMR